MRAGRKLSARFRARAIVAALEEVRVRSLGKSGWLTEKLKELGKLAGRAAQGSRRASQSRARRDPGASSTRSALELEQAAVADKLAKERIDVTLPGRGEARGGLHPVTKVRLRIEQLFRQAGFTIETGPEIEDDFHNFEALNIPADHPARAMHDTFYFPDGKLLRTHTSPVQIRAMLAGKPPFAVIAPGRVYRNDHDVTHSPMFHQVEGLLVDEGITFANLKAMLHGFLEAFFERDLEDAVASLVLPVHRAFGRSRHELRVVRRRGLPRLQTHRLARDLGCGMVHPNVLQAGGIDPEKYTGYAFGMGIDRLAMLRYGVNDLRLFFENDLRFLAQFKAG